MDWGVRVRRVAVTAALVVVVVKVAREASLAEPLLGYSSSTVRL